MRANLEDNRARRQRLFSPSFGTVTTLLSGSYIIPADSSSFHFLDGNGSARTIYLPTLTGLGGQFQIISNVGATDLNIVDADGVAVVTLLTAESGQFFSSATAWKYFRQSASSSPAPADVDYLVKTASASLSAERVVTDGAAAGTVVVDWATAGQAKFSLYGSATGKFLYTTGANTWAEGTITAAGRALIDDADAATQRATLSLVIGTNVQAWDADLDSLAAVGLTAAGLAILDDANAAAQRTTLGLAIGTNVQAYDADLDALSAWGNWKVAYSNGSGTPTFVTCGADKTVFAFNGATSAPTARTLANLGILEFGVTANLTVGYTATSFSNGTKSTGTFTPDGANGNFQHYTNGGAHTLAPPASVSSIVLECTNASAGSLTTSGFSIVSGDTYSSSGTKKHIFYINKTNSYSHLHVQYVTGT